MSQPFLQSLVALRESNPIETIAEIYRLFGSIVNMNFDESIAAYQTVRTVAEETDLIGDTMIEKILKALVIQMFFRQGDNSNGYTEMRVKRVTKGLDFGITR